VDPRHSFFGRIRQTHPASAIRIATPHHPNYLVSASLYIPSALGRQSRARQSKNEPTALVFRSGAPNSPTPRAVPIATPHHPNHPAPPHASDSLRPQPACFHATKRNRDGAARSGAPNSPPRAILITTPAPVHEHDPHHYIKPLVFTLPRNALPIPSFECGGAGVQCPRRRAESRVVSSLFTASTVAYTRSKIKLLTTQFTSRYSSIGTAASEQQIGTTTTTMLSLPRARPTPLPSKPNRTWL
jgi:hypothetical protein